MSRLLQLPLPADAAVRLSAYVAGRFGDDGGYSALHRPGSWEWQLPEADAARQRLIAAGYEMEQDPDAEWRVRWVPAVQRTWWCKVARCSTCGWVVEGKTAPACAAVHARKHNHQVSWQREERS